jgi:hypothetical protein
MEKIQEAKSLDLQALKFSDLPQFRHQILRILKSVDFLIFDYSDFAQWALAIAYKKIRKNEQGIGKIDNRSGCLVHTCLFLVLAVAASAGAWPPRLMPNKKPAIPLGIAGLAS